MSPPGDSVQGAQIIGKLELLLQYVATMSKDVAEYKDATEDALASYDRQNQARHLAISRLVENLHDDMKRRFPAA